MRDLKMAREFSAETYYTSVISGLRRGVNEMYDFLGFYAALIVGLLPTFWDNLSALKHR